LKQTLLLQPPWKHITPTIRKQLEKFSFPPH
jgi:hypothetical protein